MKAIMACDLKGGVAKNGTLPWDTIEEDMKWFRNNTKNSIVIMGADSWRDPMMPKPLPNRINVVVSNTNQPEAHYTISGTTLEMMTELKRNGLLDSEKNVWVIGGPNVLKQFMPYITEFYLTVIHDNYKCDKHIDLTQFNGWGKKFIKHTEVCSFFILKRPRGE